MADSKKFYPLEVDRTGDFTANRVPYATDFNTLADNSAFTFNPATGEVAATKFAGDGSGVTNVVASDGVSSASGTAPLSLNLAAKALTGSVAEFTGDAGAGGTAGIVPAPAAGDATKFLRGDKSWAAVSSGQMTYDAVVAASGGDYTTVGEAVAAGKYRLFVKNGTYSESAITIPVGEEFVLIGESKRGTILVFDALAANGEGIQGTGTTTTNETMDQFIVRDLTIKLTGTIGSGASALRVNSSYSTLIENIRIHIAGTASSGCNGILIDGQSADRKVPGGLFQNILVDFTDATIGSLSRGVRVDSGWGIIINNISIVNDDRTQSVYGIEHTAGYGIISNIFGYEIDRTIYVGNGCNISKIVSKGCAYDVYLNGINNIVDGVYSAGTITAQCYFNGNENTYTNGNSQAPLIFVGDYNQVSNTRVDATSGTAITINSGSDYNSLINVETGAATTPLSDAGVGTIVRSCRNIEDKNVYSQVSIEASTAGSGTPNVLTNNESWKVLTNEGSSAQNYHTLPTAVAGLVYSFIVQDADGIRIVANTGDTIRIAANVSPAAGYIESTTIGDTVELTAINNTEWVATKLVGAGWTVST